MTEGVRTWVQAGKLVGGGQTSLKPWLRLWRRSWWAQLCPIYGCRLLRSWRDVIFLREHSFLLFLCLSLISGSLYWVIIVLLPWVLQDERLISLLSPWRLLVSNSVLWVLLILVSRLVNLINKIILRSFPEHGKRVTSLLDGSLLVAIFLFDVKIYQVIRVLLPVRGLCIYLSQSVFKLILKLKNSFVVLVNVFHRFFKLNQLFDYLFRLLKLCHVFLAWISLLSETLERFCRTQNRFINFRYFRMYPIQRLLNLKPVIIIPLPWRLHIFRRLLTYIIQLILYLRLYFFRIYHSNLIQILLLYFRYLPIYSLPILFHLIIQQLVYQWYYHILITHITLSMFLYHSLSVPV